jgi:hypothetical protein
VVALTSASGHRELFGVGFLINTVPTLFFKEGAAFPAGWMAGWCAPAISEHGFAEGL